MKISIAMGPLLPVPPEQGGGGHKVWHGLAEAFAAQGHDVTMLCRAWPSHPSHEVKNNVTFVRFGGFDQSRHVIWDLIRDAIYAFKTVPRLPRADALIINDIALPVLAQLHPTCGKILINTARYPKGQLRLYPWVSRVVVPSHAVAAAAALELPDGSARVRVIPNPTNVAVFSPSAHPQEHDDTLRILYVGRVHEEKGLELLISAVRKLHTQGRRVRLRICGPVKPQAGGGGQAYKDYLLQQVHDAPVTFRPPVYTDAALAQEYRWANVFCYPSLASRGETFGVSVLEAMACGLPVVVSGLACFQDFVTPDHSGFVFEHTSRDPAHALAKVFTTCLEQPERLPQVGCAARQKALQYSYHTVAQHWIEEAACVCEEK